MSKVTNEQELRAIVGEIPNYIFECLELSDEVKEEWKHGNKASDFGSHNQFVQRFSRRIQAHTNAEIAKVLDRLKDGLDDLPYVNYKGGYQIPYEEIEAAIEAERNKLKEVK